MFGGNFFNAMRLATLRFAMMGERAARQRLWSVRAATILVATLFNCLFKLFSL